MEIKVGFEIVHTAMQPTPMVIMLSIHPSRRKDIIGAEIITAEPNVPIGFYNDSFGNICGRLVAPAGGVTLRGSALVRDSGGRIGISTAPGQFTRFKIVLPKALAMGRQVTAPGSGA